MSSDDGSDRRSVKTYVPAYQKSEWKDHAEELGMSQSEFVRTMVQAGRRGFTPEGSENVEEGQSEGSNPRGDALEERVERALSAEGVLAWEELVEELAGDFEAQLEAAIESLEDRGRVRYRPRDGGYVLTDE